MTPANQLAVVSPVDSIEDALHLLTSRDVNQPPVLRGRDFRAWSRMQNILGFVKVRRNVGSLPPKEVRRPIGRSPAVLSALSDSPAQYYDVSELLRSCSNERE